MFKVDTDVILARRGELIPANIEMLEDGKTYLKVKLTGEHLVVSSDDEESLITTDAMEAYQFASKPSEIVFAKGFIA